MEVEVATKVIDGCVLILDAVAGVQCQTKTVWKKISGRNIPAIAFINKMDRDGADFHYAMSTIPKQLHIPTLPLHHPIYDTNVKGAERPRFLGFIDLLSEQSFVWDEKKEKEEALKKSSNNNNKKKDEREFLQPTVTPIPESNNLYETLMEKKQELIDIIADYDETFMNYYLEFLSSSDDTPSILGQKELNSQLFQALQRVIKQRKVIPVICGSAIKGFGINALLDSILCFLPNPKEIQPRQMLHLTDPKATAIFPPPNTDPKVTEKILLGQVFKVVNDVNKGLMAFIRIFSGSLESKQAIYNTTKQKDERIFQILEISSNQFNPISSIPYGDIACITGCKYTRIGDTIISHHEKKIFNQFYLQGMIIPKPVYSLSIEPERTIDQKELEKILTTILTIEDPSLLMEIDQDTEQIILYGLGELHLDIVCDKIMRQYKIPITKGKSSIHYRESLQPYIQNVEFSYTYDRIIEDNKRLYAKMLFEFSSLLEDNSNNDNSSSDNVITAKEQSSAIYEIHPDAKKKLTADEFNTVNESFQAAFSRGPRGYPAIAMKVVIKEIDKIQGITTPGAIRACIAMAMRQFMKNKEHQQLLEPMMTVEIDIPNEFMGDVMTDLTSKRRASDIEVTPIPDSAHSVITAIAPLQPLLGYITVLRSMTRGEGIFSSEYIYHAPVELRYVENQ